MKMKTYFYIIVVAAVLSSCKKLIGIPANPPNQIPADQVFADSADIMGAIAGVYGNFKVAGGGTGLASGLVTQYAGLSADELSYNNAGDAASLQLLNNGLSADNGLVGSIWTAAYQQIYLVNANLIGISPSAGISDSLKRQLTGELKVIRALHYFYMINFFGKVPIVTSTDYKVTASLPRASVDSVYGLIIDDLTSARSLLRAAYPSAGRARINLYTADALLAKVYLYRGQWAAAANVASEAINSGLYSLVSDLNKVYLDGSSEAIWQLPAKGTTFQTSEGANLIPGSLYSAPNYSIPPTLLNAFETGDARRTNWISSMVYSGKTYNYPFKYKNRATAAVTTEDYMMFRLGELYLNRAEALANQGKADSAVADMNLIRLRAGLTATTGLTAQADVLKAIAHERQTELFCEWGSRWFDLKRTGTIDAVLGAEKTGWQSFDALYPIPSGEITNNSFLTQNPGY